VKETGKEKILYVGIDVAKSWLDLAVTTDGVRTIASKRVDNNPKGFKAALLWAKTHMRKQKASAVHFAVESTGIYSEGILEYLQDEDIRISMINPSQIKSFATSKLLRTRTDKIDASLIAVYLHAMKPKPTPKVPTELKQLKSLVRHLAYLTERRSEEKTYLESVTDRDVMESTRKNIKHYDREIKKIEEKIKDHLDKNSGLRKKVELLKTIPGVAETTARILLCELHHQGSYERISRKAQTAHAGLAPMEKTSGSSVRRKPKLCKTGNARLRKSLYFPAISAIKHNPVVKDFYDKLISKGKHKMVALVASMRKLLVIAIGILNNQVAFDADWEQHKRFRLLKTA